MPLVLKKRTTTEKAPIERNDLDARVGVRDGTAERRTATREMQLCLLLLLALYYMLLLLLSFALDKGKTSQGRLHGRALGSVM